MFQCQCNVFHFKNVKLTQITLRMQFFRKKFSARIKMVSYKKEIKSNQNKSQLRKNSCEITLVHNERLLMELRYIFEALN